MSTTSTEQPSETCPWCGGEIPENGDKCLTCGAGRPRRDAVIPGLTTTEAPPPEPVFPEPEHVAELGEEERARKILKDMDAYISEPEQAPAAARRDPGDDALTIIGILAIAVIVGGVVGWFVAPPLIHDIFTENLGLQSDGPEAFRRLGAFIGALVSMLFGAMVGMVVRR